MKHITNMIPAYVSGELDDKRRALVDQHLKECAACRGEVEAIGATWDFLGTGEMTTPKTNSVWPAVQARTTGTKSVGMDWFYGSGRLARTGLATVAVAAGLFLGILLPAGSGFDADADTTVTDSSWLVDSSWLTESTWLGGSDAAGIDDILLGADLLDEGNGS